MDGRGVPESAEPELESTGTESGVAGKDGMYLATIMDLYSRRMAGMWISGWYPACSMRKSYWRYSEK